MDRGAWQAIIHGVARVGHDLATKERERGRGRERRHFIVCKCQILFIYSCINGYLGYFYRLAIVNNAAMNMSVQIICLSPFFQFFWVYT